MGIYKTFFSASTAIQRNKLTNISLNPVYELYYGGGSVTASTKYTRFIFRFDTSKIRKKYSDKEIMSGNVISHKIKMTNSSSFDERLLGNELVKGRTRANDIPLILWQVPTGETWNSGIGWEYDFANKNADFGLTQKITEDSPNWFDRNKTTKWLQSGIYSGNTPTDLIGSQHFSLGNENLEIDCTEIVEKWISGGTANNGLGLSLSGNFETLTSTTINTIGFFSRHTNTIYEPYLETIWSGDTINDNRNRFFIDKTNRLFLYTNKGKDPTNLDSIPSQVTIRDYDDNIFSAITGTNVNQLTKGVYYVDVLVPNSANTMNNYTLTQWLDVWSGITIDKISLPAIEMNFILKDNKEYYNFGNNSEEPDKFGFSFYGILRGERILRGDIKKLFVIAKKEFNPEDEVVIGGLQYRLYIKQGREQIDIISWTDVHRTFNNNYLTIDTSFLLEHEYFIQLKLKSNNTEVTINENLNFFVVENLN